MVVPPSSYKVDNQMKIEEEEIVPPPIGNGQRHFAALMQNDKRYEIVKQKNFYSCIKP